MGEDWENGEWAKIGEIILEPTAEKDIRQSELRETTLPLFPRPFTVETPVAKSRADFQIAWCLCGRRNRRAGDRIHLC